MHGAGDRACRAPECELHHGHGSIAKRANRLTPRNATSYDITRDVVIVSDPTLLVLASLADGEKHGYAMMEDIQRFAGVRLGPGTLYGAITRLEEQGWIRPVESEDRRKPYRLTADGRRHLEERMSRLDRVVKAAQQRLKPA